MLAEVIRSTQAAGPVTQRRALGSAASCRWGWVEKSCVRFARYFKTCVQPFSVQELSIFIIANKQLKEKNHGKVTNQNHDRWL